MTPRARILGRTASDENVAEVRELMGLDRPAYERYFDWLGGLLTGRPRELRGGLRAGR